MTTYNPREYAVEIDMEMKRKTLQSCEKTAAQEGRAWSIMAAQQGHLIMVVGAVVMAPDHISENR